MTFMTDAELDDIYERSKLDHEIIVGSEIRVLVGEIRHHRAQERCERVDITLAKRLGERIEKEAGMKVELQRWLDCYALDIFPEPDLGKAAEVLKTNGMTIDSLSANMGRHVLTRVLKMLNDPETP